MADERPAPRLPLDDTVVTGIEEAGLGAMITAGPDGPHQLSFLQTQTPNYWPSAFNRDVYADRLDGVYDDQASLEAIVRPVLQEFATARPRPPQAK